MNPYNNTLDIYPNTTYLGNNQQNNIDPLTFYNQFNDFSGLQQLTNPVICIQRSDMSFNETFDQLEIPDTCFNYITNILRENDLDDRPNVTLNDYMTAQVSYNKSLDACISTNQCLDYLNMFNSTNNNVNAVNNIDVGYQNVIVGNDNDGCGFDNSCFDHQYDNGPVFGFLSNENCEIDPLLQNSVLENDVLPSSFVGFQGFGGGDVRVDVTSGRKNNKANGETGNETNSVLGNDVLPSSVLGFQGFGGEEFRGDDTSGRENNKANGETGNETNSVLENGVLQSSFVGFQGFGGEEVRGDDTSGRKQNEANGETGNETSGKTRGRKHNEANGETAENQEGGENERGSKNLAVNNEDWCEKIEEYGDVLLCPEGRNKPAALCGKSVLLNADDKKEKKGGNSGKKRGSKRQVVDLRALLTRCAQCVARVDLVGAYDLLKQIRQYSSPYGDFLQRVAHYLANGLEARLEGKGSELTRANDHISPCEVLKANRVFVGSVPFKIMSYYTTNKTIASLAMESSSIHIIDFGIYYGLQWPCIIQNLSKRPNGPPKIRITGIDFPQRGFRPSERVEETGRCLAMYCEKYNVPFEYNGIAQQWETIKLEDLKIEPNEPLVVNCLYRSHNLFDESVDDVFDSSPRDAFLRLVRKINPDMFMHGIVNSTSSVPFFLNRFKEVMFHYSALFDVFESTMSREDNERMLLESKLYGNQALNVIACEGVERVERQETNKQWNVRTQRAGFVQVPLDRDLVRRARAMVKRSFREEFSYDEDGHWVVQGWKGRILYAISCWKPV